MGRGGGGGCRTRGGNAAESDGFQGRQVEDAGLAGSHEPNSRFAAAKHLSQLNYTFAAGNVRLQPRRCAL